MNLNESLDYKKNYKYFNPGKLAGPIIAIIIGFIFLCVPAAGAKVFGVLLLILGIVLIVLHVKNQVSDEFIDNEVESALQNMLPHALERLGVDEEEVKEIDPIILKSYDSEGISDGQFFFKQGKDMRWRSSVVKAVYIFASDQQLYCYTLRFSLSTDKHTEETDEYFYRDIVSIYTGNVDETYKDSKGVEWHYSGDMFKLTTSGGTSISQLIRNEDEASGKISAMKQLLREKKKAQQ